MKHLIVFKVIIYIHLMLPLSFGASYLCMRLIKRFVLISTEQLGSADLAS